MKVKVCGLTTPDTLKVASEAAYVGFVFFPRSPRNIDFADAADLAGRVRPGVCKVALTVNADDAFLDTLLKQVPIDMLQLHGSETPDRVQDVKSRYGLPVMKAVGIATADDLPALDVHAEAADQILVDAKPIQGALPGGNGVSFDWQLLAGRHWSKPWMLAGGLTPENVSEAARLTGAAQVDVSSGVESAPGQKDPALIAAFLDAATD